MDKVLIFGHKNPDTDSICSAIGYANLKEKLGHNVEAVKLGPINKETNYALDYFEVETPRFIDKVDEDVKSVILVDHNEFQQSVNNIKDLNIIEVIDHHRIANFETKDPIYFRVEPVGCTATIINKMYKENDVTISKKIAGLLLSAIISDTLLFKSPTCTDEDVAAAKELAEIANVDADEYGLAMLQAGADVSDKSVSELISMDAKEFTMGNKKVEIAQINTVNISEVFERQQSFENEIAKVIEDKDLSLFLLVVTDIINSNSEALALGADKGNVEKTFNVILNNNRALLEGIVSRKKQIVTQLTSTFDQQ